MGARLILLVCFLTLPPWGGVPQAQVTCRTDALGNQVCGGIGTERPRLRLPGGATAPDGPGGSGYIDGGRRDSFGTIRLRDGEGGGAMRGAGDGEMPGPTGNTVRICRTDTLGNVICPTRPTR